MGAWAGGLVGGWAGEWVVGRVGGWVGEWEHLQGSRLEA